MITLELRIENYEMTVDMRRRVPAVVETWRAASVRDTVRPFVVSGLMPFLNTTVVTARYEAVAEESKN